MKELTTYREAREEVQARVNELTDGEWMVAVFRPIPGGVEIRNVSWKFPNALMFKAISALANNLNEQIASSEKKDKPLPKAEPGPMEMFFGGRRPLPISESVIGICEGRGAKPPAGEIKPFEVQQNVPAPPKETPLTCESEEDVE